MLPEPGRTPGQFGGYQGPDRLQAPSWQLWWEAVYNC